ncbi:3-oxoacyl-ACP reductase family protein [Actinokineospora xionganensis]|uniref:3-oxoacyl-ACP reductase FabG n=1 Tax=Actinokineospora xionganensis TaxID=2684470 RepID=A0ABR7L7U6_9PSEU|nr:3-oxoacyl-ACP reductase family protein [Actinokineospora xionganensis]MBC6448474.1 3-oxoacyl-ACP reductase FabG [Actinokineospora xionganensis]
MNTPLEGKAALVTGGSRGIGAATAIRLAQDGADVAFTFHSNETAAAAVVEQIKATGGRALAIQADSADAGAVMAAVEQTAAEFGRFDILVNNAATYVVEPLEELDFAAFDRSVAVNIRAPFAAAKAAVPLMADGGRIISIGTLVNDRVAFPNYTHYATTKTALIGLTKGLARELGPRGITVNLVNPGPTDTELNPADGPYADTIRGFTALGRFAEPSEVAGAVAFLAGPDGRYVTGATLTIDGGFTS